MRAFTRFGHFAVTLALLVPTAALAQSSRVVSESYHVAAGDAGIQLYVRNKRPEGVTRFGSDRIVLFVHGATYPSESAFDLPLNGLSWMDYIAQRGWDVYLMDIRGYGASTRPPQMSLPPTENQPIVNTDVAVRDVGAVVDHILKRRGVAKINLMGWSWGTAIMGAYTAQNNAKVERLVLYAPLWLVKDAPPIGGQGPLGAYRTVTRDAAQQRWLRGVPPDKQQELIPTGWFEAWWNANMAADPDGARLTPPVVRAPNGIIEDLRKYWMSGAPHYDPANITVPTLLILAEWDADTPPYMAQAVFAKLTAAPRKRMVMIGEGTHTVALERNRMQLFHEVQAFLDEPR
jgi:pimeloyl-ACP methyl ester carboxylesterase